MHDGPTRPESDAVATTTTTQTAKIPHPDWCPGWLGPDAPEDMACCEVDGYRLDGEHVGMRTRFRGSDGCELELALVQFVEPGEQASAVQLRLEVVNCGVEVGLDPVIIRLSGGDTTSLLGLIGSLNEQRREGDR